MDEKLHKKALKLSYFTVSYNLVEGVVSILGGYMLGSVSLVGFGLDSFVESLSSSILIWRFRQHLGTEEEEEKLEQKATKLIAYTFFILGAYVLYESAKKLYLHEAPEQSLLGVVIAGLSILIMVGIWRKKYQLGKLMHSDSLIADSKQTLACIFMSFTLLAGLGLNYIYGLWWTDGVAGIVIAGFLFKEGFESFSGEGHHH